jgi:hypothetical protein
MSWTRVICVFIILLFMSTPCYSLELKLEQLTYPQEEIPRYQRTILKLGTRFWSKLFREEIREDRQRRLLEDDTSYFFRQDIGLISFRRSGLFGFSKPLLKYKYFELAEDFRLRFRAPAVGEFSSNVFKVDSKFVLRTKLKLKVVLGSKNIIQSIQTKLTQVARIGTNKFTLQVRFRHKVHRNKWILAAVIKWIF